MNDIPDFETTLERTNLWIQDVMTELRSEDPHEAYIALRGVFHALRDRLQTDEVVRSLLLRRPLALQCPAAGADLRRGRVMAIQSLPHTQHRRMRR